MVKVKGIVNMCSFHSVITSQLTFLSMYRYIVENSLIQSCVCMPLPSVMVTEMFSARAEIPRVEKTLFFFILNGKIEIEIVFISFCVWKIIRHKCELKDVINWIETVRLTLIQFMCVNNMTFIIVFLQHTIALYWAKELSLT